MGIIYNPNLERLFADYLRRNGAGIYSAAFINAKCYPTTPPTDISVQSKEYRDKAYLQFFAAGTHENDTAILARQLFSGKHQLIDLEESFFDPVCDQIADFCHQLP